MSDNPVEPPDSDDDDRLSETALLQRYAARILHLQEQERRRLKTAQLRRLREQQAREQQEQQRRQGQRMRSREQQVREQQRQQLQEQQRTRQERFSLCWPRHKAWHATAHNELPGVLSFSQYLARRHQRENVSSTDFIDAQLRGPPFPPGAFGNREEGRAAPAQ